MVFNLTGQMEYRAIEVHDPSVLIASPLDRLGRKIHNILPAVLMEHFDRATFQARKTGRPASYDFPVRDATFRATVAAPSKDSIIASVCKVLCAITSCEILAGVCNWV
jgi:hypothetical protein